MSQVVFNHLLASVTLLPPIVELPAEEIRMNEWVDYLGRQSTNERILKVFKEIPETPISVNNFMYSDAFGRLIAIFKPLTVREIESILKWMDKRLLPEQFADIPSLELTIVLQNRASPIYCLFLALREALVEKGLLEDFSQTDIYKSLDVDFTHLYSSGDIIQ